MEGVSDLTPFFFFLKYDILKIKIGKKKYASYYVENRQKKEWKQVDWLRLGLE